MSFCISEHGFPSETHCNFLWIWFSLFRKNTPAPTVGWFIRLDFTYRHNTTYNLTWPVWKELVWTSMGSHKLLRGLEKSNGNFSITSDLLPFFLTTQCMLGITVSLNVFLRVNISNISILVLNSSLKTYSLTYFYIYLYNINYLYILKKNFKQKEM